MVYFTAITLKLNTKPWKENGTTSKKEYKKQLNELCIAFNCNLAVDLGWEMDKLCQLHVHGTLVSEKILHRKKISNYYRNIYRKYSIWLRPIDDYTNWKSYCLKSGIQDQEKVYNLISDFYKVDENEELEQLEIASEIQDYDFVKFNHETKHWELKLKKKLTVFKNYLK